MAHKGRFGGVLALAAAALGVSAAAQVTAPCVPGDWQSSEPAVIAARPGLPPDASDAGAAPAPERLERMLLLLRPSVEQQAALDTELANQQDPKSAEYHHWLTPAQFADAYANAPSEVAAVVSWLQSEGFTVAPLPAGRGWIEFSGTVAQVERAFRTHVRFLATRAGVRAALGDSIAAPAALSSLIEGLVSLDGATPEAAVTPARAVQTRVADLVKVSSAEQAEALTPQLAARLLHLEGLYASGTTGAGESIAIAARSNIQREDVAAFRSAFGLAPNPIQVVLSGADPGQNSDEAAAVLSASWAGAAAPGARIVLVPAATTSATDGIDLSLEAIVDQALAHTVAVGYSSCEAALSAAHRAFYAALYRQAAAQGMAIMGATGDGGPSACHAAGSETAITIGFGVNALASTPWNTAVGTAAFAETGSGALTAWSPIHPAEPAYAGGGGASAFHSTPPWQPLPARAASAMPGRFARMIPDVALPTAAESGANRGLVFCLSATNHGSPECNALRAGGSAAAAALFAGVAAMIAETHGPQGNLAPGLYQLQGMSGVFEDVQQGSARLACVEGSPGCDASGLIGFAAGPGYDLATGLGSVDAQRLVRNWGTLAPTGTALANVLLTVSPTALNNTYNPSAQITFSATVSSALGGATPTGNVTFSDATPGGTITIGGANVTLDSSGKASVTVNSGLPIGGNNVTAVYNGDPTYAASSSKPPFVVTIAKSQTTPAITAPATVAAGATFTATVSLTAGTPPAGSLPPGGNVTMAVDGVAVASSALTTAGGVTSATFTLTAPTTSGSHNLQATYPGDANYSSSVATASFSISKAATVTTLTATPPVLTPGVAETLTATVAPLNSSTSSYTITGTVTFFDGSVLLGTATLAMNSASLSGVALSTATAHSLTAVYSGDPSWSASTSSPLVLTPVLLPDSVTLAVTPATAAPGQVVTLVATVTPATAPAATGEQNPTGNVIFYNGTTAIGTAPLVAGPNHTATATLFTANLPAGNVVLTAYYVGDSFYASGTSNAITISVLDFAIAPASTNPPTNLNIVKGSSGQASFVVSGLGGFNNLIQVVCSVPTQDDMTCQASPQQVTPTATVTFTVQTFAAGGPTASSRPPAPLWPRALGSTALAALVFLVLPFGRRARRFDGWSRGLVVLGLLLGGLGGCGTSVSAPPVSTGTPLGVATLTITATAYVDNTVISHSVYLTVNVVPTGSSAVVKRTSIRK